MGQGSLADLASLMNRHPTWSRTFPSIGESRLHVIVTPSGPCSLGVVKHHTIGPDVYHQEYTIALGQWAPDAEVSKSTAERWRVELRSSTGAPAASIRLSSTERGVSSSQDFATATLTFYYDDEGVAGAVASGFQRVIAGCGGAPLTQAARDSAAATAATEAENTRLKNECRNLVRRQTTDPNGVTFDSPVPDLVLRSEGKVSIMGDFTGTLQGGARRQANYACTFVRRGSEWAPEAIPLIY
jgi:hypothetical protein